MTRTYYARGREAEYLARDRLRSLGYTVARTVELHLPVDIIAWRKPGDLLFLQVRRTRTLDSSVERISQVYHADIEAMRAMEVPRSSSVQLWLWVDHQGWRLFDVMPGGLCEVAGHVV